MTRLRGAALLALLIGALAAPGCGGASSASPDRSSASVSAGPAATRAGSPERAVTTWWRALQGGDVAAAARALPGEPSLRQGLPVLSALARFLKLEVVAVHRSGRHAVVYTLVVVSRRVGRRRLVKALALPQGFPLVRDGTGWRLQDSFFLTRVGGSVLQATRGG